MWRERAQKRYFFLWQTNIQRKLATTLKTKTSTKEHVNALSSLDESWHSHRPPPHVHHHQWVRENIHQFTSLRWSRLDSQAYVERQKEWGKLLKVKKVGKTSNNLNLAKISTKEHVNVIWKLALPNNATRRPTTITSREEDHQSVSQLEVSSQPKRWRRCTKYWN